MFYNMLLLSKYKLLILFLLTLCGLLLYTYISILESDLTFLDKFISKSKLIVGPQTVHSQLRTENKVEDLEVDKVVISFVVCDSRFLESLNVVKSVLLFTSSPVYFVIFTDKDLMPKFNNTLTLWKSMRSNLDFELHRISFPESHEEDWLNLFSKCAAQRLFIPILLPHIDSLIYVDTDVLFLGPADELWQHFYKFNSSQMSALALEDDNPNVSWYPRFAKHPFYGNFGVNSGVMLMNLTRMRTFGWVDYVTPIMLKWKLYIPWGDQDIINIIFHYHGEAVYLISCRYNYRTDQCMYGDACSSASTDGVFLMHGSRKAFHSHKQPAFEAVYRAIDQYELDTDPRVAVMPNLVKYLDESSPSNCGSMKEAIIKVPNATIYNIYSKPDR